VTERFMSAAATGDMEGLLSMLAPDATWTADSGGKAKAIRRPVVGAKKVAALIASFFRVAPQHVPDIRFETANYNNAPAVVVYNGDHVLGVFLVEIINGSLGGRFVVGAFDESAVLELRAGPHECDQVRRSHRTPA
jgi:RNA polymerase sigma-70 factor, ECF subfamily